MYNDNQVPVYVFSLQTGLVSWRVLNAAKEEVEKPVMIEWNATNYGVMVPYGGYLEVQTDSTHTLSVFSGASNRTLAVVQPSSTTVFKVVSLLECRVSSVSTIANYDAPT